MNTMFEQKLASLRTELYEAHKRKKIPYFNISYVMNSDMTIPSDLQIKLLICLNKDQMHKEEELKEHIQKKYGDILSSILIEENLWIGF